MTYFAHVRHYRDENQDVRSFRNTDIVATVAVTREENMINVGFAIPSKDDMPCKRVGRQKAEGRAHSKRSRLSFQIDDANGEAFLANRIMFVLAGDIKREVTGAEIHEKATLIARDVFAKNHANA